MSPKWSSLFRRCAAVALCATMITAEAGAVIKNVKVWGARSANDLGNSDYRITMDDLKDDFSSYIKTDGLTEYFHKDKDVPVKGQMDEAMSWLIDAGIIIRDSSITITPGSYSGGDGGIPPAAHITKADVMDMLYYNVRRSDALMYLYKAVFGPIDMRSVGVYGPCFRADLIEGFLFETNADGSVNMGKPIGFLYNQNAEIKALDWIIHKNTAEEIPEVIIFYCMVDGCEGHDGEPGHDGLAGSGAGGDGADGNDGGDGGKAEAHIVYTTTNNLWAYTPQGDEYISMFGDTNIFISENYFEQHSHAGGGGTGGNGGDGGNGGNATGAYGDWYVGSYVPGQGGDGGNGGAGGGGGGGGAANTTINYETDYKSIRYDDGNDATFYRTNDAIEPYLAALYSMGILEDNMLTTEKNLGSSGTPLFEKVIMNKVNESATTTLPFWSHNANPYFIMGGMPAEVHSIPADTTENPLAQSYPAGCDYTSILGRNYTFKTTTLNGAAAICIQRATHFQSDTGYFITEYMTRMEVYRYIYKMISANEKKMTQLEADIVNFKYGMQYEGLAKDEDVEIIKYLVAK